MPRYITVGAAQSGPVTRDESREEVVARLIEQMRRAAASGCDLVVFTECALTAFFPHWWIEQEEELDQYFEFTMPSAATRPLFQEATRLRIGFHLGFAERVEEAGRVCRYNSSILVDKAGLIIGRFRKIHLPGYAEPRPDHSFQNLEKRYFQVGDLGFRTWKFQEGVVGLCICNDRRWPETYRTLALQGAEMVLLGYNTPDTNPEFPETNPLTNFHNHLCLQAGAYQNGLWVVAVAKAGEEEGVRQIGQSCIIAPSGEIVAQTSTLGDELIVHRCNLDEARRYHQQLWNFAGNRQIKHYQRIGQQAAATPPE